MTLKVHQLLDRIGAELDAKPGNKIRPPTVELTPRMLAVVRSWMPEGFTPLNSKERALLASTQARWEQIFTLENSLDAKRLWADEQRDLTRGLAEGLALPGRSAKDLAGWQAHVVSTQAACKAARAQVAASANPLVKKAFESYASALRDKASALEVDARAQSDLLGVAYERTPETACVQAVEDFARRAARDADKPTNASPASRLAHVLTTNP